MNCKIIKHETLFKQNNFIHIMFTLQDDFYDLYALTSAHFVGHTRNNVLDYSYSIVCFEW